MVESSRYKTIINKMCLIIAKINQKNLNIFIEDDINVVVVNNIGVNWMNL